MIPFRHLIGLVVLSLLILVAAASAVYLLPSPRPATGADDPVLASVPGEGRVAFNPSALYAARAEAVLSVTALDDKGEAVTGTGFLIDRKGHLLTNQHVIAGSTRITVSVGDAGEQVVARALGADPGSDTALLQIDLPEGFDPDPIPLGDAGVLRVGDPVLAIGSPFGLERTATAGIVSALHRQIEAPDGFPIPGTIQTDAAINHGNSGGPLLDRSGRAVGINTQIAASGVDANVGVAFSLPINIARANVERWLAGETVGHAWIGVKAATLPEPLARELGLKGGGVQLLAVTPDGPASDAGLRAVSSSTTIDGVPYPSGGDIIVAAGDRRLSSFEDLQEALAASAPGQALSLKVVRSGEPRTVTVRLRARP